LWFEPHEALDDHSFVYVSVSDGVSLGIVVNGELLHGRDDIASEFRHLPLNLDGPNCMCDTPGCWEGYISNLATLSRYFGWKLSKPGTQAVRAKAQAFTVLDLVARARSGDQKAVAAMQATGRFLGLGLAAIVNVVNPDCIYLAGEITTAWDLIENSVRDGMSNLTLTAAAARTPLRVTPNQDHPRLRGAAALIAARTFNALS
jgi:predicted NBD/HSP70 family sugar kinase